MNLKKKEPFTFTLNITTKLIEISLNVEATLANFCNY